MRAGLRGPVRRAGAVALAAALAACSFAGAGVVARRSDAHAARQLYPTREQLLDYSYIRSFYDERRAAGYDTHLVLGSSELYPAPGLLYHPTTMLAGSQTGVDALMLGRPGCSDVWQAVELGALARDGAPKRVVLIPSMLWYTAGRDPQADYPGIFSRGTYDAFIAQDRISDESKQWVARRLRAYGVMVDEPRGALGRAASMVDGGVAAELETIRRILSPAHDAAAPVMRPPRANGARGSAAQASAPPHEPRWEDLYRRAHAASELSHEGSDNGCYRSWNERGLERFTRRAREWEERGSGELSTQELEDFEQTLSICRQLGLEACVLIQPVNGFLYDQTVYGREVRSRYYQMLRDACTRANVAYADLSSHEYDPLFFRDDNHPSSVGALYYARAMWTYLAGGAPDVSSLGAP
ncbi:hypothetical protein E4J93_00820 [Collinsella sp. BA40]|nr:hypothetical protein E4J93_00820 [Collinsella sp. BA40]